MGCGLIDYVWQLVLYCFLQLKVLRQWLLSRSTHERRERLKLSNQAEQWRKRFELEVSNIRALQLSVQEVIFLMQIFWKVEGTTPPLGFLGYAEVEMAERGIHAFARSGDRYIYNGNRIRQHSWGIGEYSATTVGAQARDWMDQSVEHCGRQWRNPPPPESYAGPRNSEDIADEARRGHRGDQEGSEDDRVRILC
ncbi:hypothetical protein MMC13_001144 [Lambiella insularis]|nr:hypothetical protein [Lambiella insularis]